MIEYFHNKNLHFTICISLATTFAQMFTIRIHLSTFRCHKSTFKLFDLKFETTTNIRNERSGCWLLIVQNFNFISF